MAGPNLPVNVDAVYADQAGDPSVKAHQAAHDSIHRVVNRFDMDAVPAVGQVPRWNGTLYLPDSLDSSDVPTVSVNPRTASYTLAATDAGKVVEMNVATANTITVPSVLSVPWATGTVIGLRAWGTGITTVTPVSGVLVHSRGQVKTLAGQYSEAMLTYRGSDTWILSGDIA